MADFIEADLISSCRDPESIPNLDHAVAVMLRHIRLGSDIVVFGDYDADGVCSITVMRRFLEAFGAPPRAALVPDRLADGHGLSANAVDMLLEQKPTLLIVVDCGTTSSAALERISPVVEDIVVIDHHSTKGLAWPQVPKNVVLVNPAIAADPAVRRRWGIGSAGVLTYCAVLRAGRVWRAAPDRPPAPTDIDLKTMLHDVLGLAAITAVSDMVPLVGLNRAIVRHGLQFTAKLPGIKALASALPKALDPEHITAEDVGFKYGPVLNAAGRIAHGVTALRLLHETGAEALSVTAAEAVEINLNRRDIQTDVVEKCVRELKQALADSGTRACGMVVRNPTFHPGVVGLAASRLMEITGRPAIVIGSGGAGSGRSIAGCNIGEFINGQVDLKRLAKGGGHAGAAGFTLAAPDDPDSHLAFAADFEVATAGVLRPPVLTDLVLGVDPWPDLDALYWSMAPFGMAHTAIRIAVENPTLASQKWFGAAGNHWKAKLVQGKANVEAILFNAGSATCDTIVAAYQAKQVFEPGRIARLEGYLRGQFDTYWNKPTLNIVVDRIHLST